MFVIMIFSYGNDSHKIDGFFKSHLQNELFHILD
jgi:hypothetical protein